MKPVNSRITYFKQLDAVKDYSSKRTSTYKLYVEEAKKSHKLSKILDLDERQHFDVIADEVIEDVSAS